MLFSVCQALFSSFFEVLFGVLPNPGKQLHYFLLFSASLRDSFVIISYMREKVKHKNTKNRIKIPVCEFRIFFLLLGILFLPETNKERSVFTLMQWKKSFAALSLVTVLLFAFLLSLDIPASALSQMGSRGEEVKAIQERLQERGLYNGDIDGVYGAQTKNAVKKFQKQQGLTQDGIAGPATLKKLGISIGSIPAATESNVYLLARIISAESRGEPYSGQVAVGAVVLNRVEHPSFPDTLAGVIYQDGAFTAIVDGQFDEPIAESAYQAARDALAGQDPSGGAIYYFNPDKTSNKWIRTRPVIKRIGAHLFCS